MKIFERIANATRPTSYELECICTLKPKKISPNFAVKINDRGDGMYYLGFLKNLVSKELRPNRISDLEYGDVVTFVKDRGDIEISYYDRSELPRNLGMTRFNLVEDWEEIKEAFLSLVGERKSSNSSALLASVVECPVCGTDLLVTTRKEKASSFILRDSEVVAPNKKVTIFSNFVKIGYEQYRISKNDWTGERFVVINGFVYNVKKSRYGKQYLQLV